MTNFFDGWEGNVELPDGTQELVKALGWIAALKSECRPAVGDKPAVTYGDDPENWFHLDESSVQVKAVKGIAPTGAGPAHFPAPNGGANVTVIEVGRGDGSFPLPSFCIVEGTYTAMTAEEFKDLNMELISRPDGYFIMWPQFKALLERLAALIPGTTYPLLGP